MINSKYTLAELIASTSCEFDMSPEMVEWDRMPAVGREWPSAGWDALPIEQNAIDAKQCAAADVRGLHTKRRRR